MINLKPVFLPPKEARTGRGFLLYLVPLIQFSIVIFQGNQESSYSPVFYHTRAINRGYYPPSVRAVIIFLFYLQWLSLGRLGEVRSTSVTDKRPGS
eukprot:SAG31_NODE_1079_length_10031_cov_5.270741_7_plen_96_part_00